VMFTEGRKGSREGFFAMKRRRTTGDHFLRFLCVLL
jgi:hypothetical protein